MKLLAGAVVVAVGAGLGTFFGLGVVPHPRPPVDKRWPVLDAAISRGLIRGYRADSRGYGIAGSTITVHVVNSCGDHSCPAPIRPVVAIEYEHSSASQAERLAGFVRPRWYGDVKTFEVTIP
jgi:hypothetical protein